MNKCKICDNSIDFEIFKVKEMMYGLDEYFDYIQCKKCGCLQLINIPEDFSKYYSQNYYSFKNKKKNKFRYVNNRRSSRYDEYIL